MIEEDITEQLLGARGLQPLPWGASHMGRGIMIINFNGSMASLPPTFHSSVMHNNSKRKKYLNIQVFLEFFWFYIGNMFSQVEFLGNNNNCIFSHEIEFLIIL